MGVYTKGMEMPTRCYGCPFCDYVSARCDAVKGNPYTPESRYEQRADFCPLVPVPPHGRLIDADALAEKHEIMAYENGGKSYDFHITAKAWVDNAPTIIEAEGEDN